MERFTGLRKYVFFLIGCNESPIEPMAAWMLLAFPLPNFFRQWISLEKTILFDVVDAPSCLLWDKTTTHRKYPLSFTNDTKVGVSNTSDG